MGSGPSLGEPRVDTAAECIWRDGEQVRVPPKAFLVLRQLMERPHHLITKRDLMDAVWRDTYVSETVLNVAIGQLRQALGDDPRQPRFIETVHRRGFRWIAPPTDESGGTRNRSDLTSNPSDISSESLFVGRADPLAALKLCYARAENRQRQVVFVTGDPGIGKTTLVEEFLRGLPSRTSVLLGRGQCLEAVHAVDPYRPIFEALESVLRDGGAETRALFARHAAGWLLQMPGILSPTEVDELRRTAGTTTVERMQRELEGAIEALAAQRVVVLLLEDLHWSDAATVGLLWALAMRREPSRLLIIGTYRPVDAIVHRHPILRMKHELASKQQCLELPLDGLGVDAVRTYLDRRFPGHEFPETLPARMQEQASGNPLFLLNALADFERRGWLRQRGGSWKLTADLEVLAAAVPEDTRELISFRIDQHSPATQEMLEAASIAGIAFATQEVAAATGQSSAEIEEECERLARSALFLQGGEDIHWPDGTCGRHYQFRHALYRQVLAGRVPPTRCQLLHRRIAERLERGYGEQVTGMAAKLSFHYEQAGDIFRAVDFIDKRMPQVDARRAVYETEALLRHTIALLHRLPQSEERQRRLLRATWEHGMTLAAAHGSGSAESLRAFEAARAIGKTLPTSPAQLVSLGTIAGVHVVSGQLREAVSVGEQVLVLAGDNPSPDLVLMAQASIATARLYLGDIDAALSSFDRGFATLAGKLETVVEAPYPWPYYPAVAMQTACGLALALSGKADQGWRLVQSGLAQARGLNLPNYREFALSAVSMTAIIRRDFAAARSASAEFLEHSVQAGFALLARVCVDWLAVVDTPDPALIGPLRQAVQDYCEVARLGAPRVFSLLADACLRVGLLDDAAQALDLAFDLRNEERVFDAELLRQRASLAHARATLSQNDRLDEAEELLERAIDVASAQGTRLFGLRATVDLCRLWVAAGKTDEARERLGAALTGFTEGFGEFDLRAATELLSSLHSEDKGAH